jgi:uncharacterized membrane protein YphA (DoxX/SURF4 family)
MNCKTSTLLALAAVAFLRIVIGLHFFLEGMSHLRDPNWSSAPFRKAAVGPLAESFRKGLPETGDWSGTLGAMDAADAADASGRWKASLVESWKKLLRDRQAKLTLDPSGLAAAERQLEDAASELDSYAAGIADDLVAYRLELQRLRDAERGRAASEIPFARDRIAKKRRELAGQAAGWMKEAAAIGTRLVATWDEPLSAADRIAVADAAGPTSLWKADRFVSWSLVTIGACLVLGLCVKFNAIGGACFLASIVASQPFWVAGAQATYDQWVELAALLAIAALPTAGWSGLDYFLKQWCPSSWCCSARQSGPSSS